MVSCPLCGQDVNWVTLKQTAQLLEITPTRVSQFIKAGRLPGAQKHRPGSGIQPIWKIPIESVVAFRNMRLQDQGLMSR